MSLIGSLKCVVVPATGKHTATVIWSHGLGDTAAGWTFLAQELGPKMPHIKWILPTAPVRPVTVNGGMHMNSWFDIQAFSPTAPQDEQGMLKSVAAVNHIIDQEVNAGLPSSRIVVGGFSQGAAISLLTGVTTQRKLAGIVALSGYLPLQPKADGWQKPEFKDIHLFQGHGTDDPIVVYPRASTSVDFMRSQLKMTNVRFETYPGLPHSASPKELNDLAEWLAERLPKESSM